MSIRFTLSVSSNSWAQSRRHPALHGFVLGMLLGLQVPLAQARDVAGIEVDEHAGLEGIDLQLNGAGVRSKFFIKIYVAALYVRSPSPEAASIIETDSPRRIEMHFLHDVDAPKLAAAWREGFDANNDQAQLEALGSRIDRFAGLFGDAAEGDVFALDYVPATGTRVLANGAERGVIEGRDFSEALLRVWLGPHPVDEDLKAKLLGR